MDILTHFPLHREFLYRISDFNIIVTWKNRFSGMAWVSFLFCLCIIVCLLVTLGLCGYGQGRTITVDNNCPADHSAIQEAIDNSTDGDTILVSGGMYYESIVVNTSIDLVGNGPGSTIIDGAGDKVVVLIQAAHVNMTGFTVMNSTKSYSWINHAGIKVMADHFTISNCTITSNYQGLLLYQAENATIQNVDCSNNAEMGIYLPDSENCTIRNTTCRDNEYGCYASSDGNVIENCTFSENLEDGLLCYPRSYVKDNYCPANGRCGIYLVGPNSTLINNRAQGNGWAGIAFSGTDNTIVLNNTISNNNEYDIWIRSTVNLTLSGNTMSRGLYFYESLKPEEWGSHTIDTSNTVNGRSVWYYTNPGETTITDLEGQIIVANCSLISIENCTAGAGIIIGFSSEVIVENCAIIESPGTGIYLDHSTSCYLRNNAISNNSGYGIYLYRSDKMNSVEGNVISGNLYDGIYIEDSSSNFISDNQIISNRENGTRISRSDGTYIRYNVISRNSGNGSLIFDSDSTYVEMNVMSNNTLNGIAVNTDFYHSAYQKEMKSWIFSNVITGNGENGTCLVSVETVEIRRNEISGNLNNSIYMWDSGHNKIFGNNLTDSGLDGIAIYDSWYDEILENIISGNRNGILISTKKKWSTDISQYCSHHTIEGNIIVENMVGIHGGVNCYIHGNTIFYNHEYGIYYEKGMNINATGNYWGHPSGPYKRYDNSFGLGDNILGGVSYKPWLTEGIIEPPYIEFISHANEDKVWDIFEVSGNASDDEQIMLVEWRMREGDEWLRVEVMDDGISTVNWTITVNLTDYEPGEYTLEFRAFDGRFYSRTHELTLQVNMEKEEDDDEPDMVRVVSMWVVVGVMAMAFIFTGWWDTKRK